MALEPDALEQPELIEVVTKETFPEFVPKETLMELAPCPELMVAPEGTVHE